ncbi:MAG TPA: Ig-like domain-containing protein [Kofleriaceae bacterium]|jgi:hypothetical protein|nr:Ig-like domain-containing protein [Kofleriaceae bacterium]
MDAALRWVAPRAACAALAGLAAACSQPASATDLHPGGPPMIEQVRLEESYAIGASTGQRVVFGFGTHAGATPDDQHPVTTATAAGNRLRIIMDELLRGDTLEEIACRFPVDTEAFARVPPGATPDDIARCAVPQAALPARCPGSDPHAVCLCARDGGCASGTDPDGSPHLTPRGESVGVLDEDQDGAADTTRLIAGAVAIRCGSIDAPIDVPIDLASSSWTPSGDQQTPALGGFDTLGPAVVVVPGPAPGVALPTNLDCGIAFSPGVVDPDGHAVCAPPGGDLTAGCTPGDTSAVHFHVEPLAFAVAPPVDPQAQPLDGDVRIVASAPIDAGSLANVTVTRDPGGPYTQFTVGIPSAQRPNQILIHWTPALPPSTHFTIDVPAAVTDRYHQPPLQPLQVAFTTAAM